MIGRTLAHYEIVDLLGRGGMGEVYRARDTKLGRDVALKVLPREMSGDPERLARFSREARSLAALQHANVASIYGFEEAEGVRFLVMELVEGEDLAVRLRKGPIPLAQALEFGHQIAEGLEAAHEKGIVHRDLKPANVKLTPEGSVKILDFGLARAMQGEAASDADLANSPTITAAMTQAGVILGTAAYMSPEQARGGVADARADIWAFGVLLWEMLTGQRLFEGETVSDTLASILKLPPDWSQLPSDTPARVRDLLERCLAKKRRDRLGAIADARLEIEWVLAGRDAVAEAPAATTRRRWGRALAVGLPLLVLAFLGGLLYPQRAPEATSESRGTYVLSLPIPDELVHLGELLAPDGSCIAVRARLRNPSSPAEAPQALYIRAFDRTEFRRVEASLDLRSYGFSHDARWIGLVAPASPGSSQLRFWRVPTDGSAPPTSLFDWSEDWSHMFLWLPDGDLLVDVESTAILRVPTDGRSVGEPIALDLPTGFTGVEMYPQHNALLPDGRHLLTWSHSYATGQYDQTGALLDLDTGSMRPLLLDTGRMVYWPTGHLLFGRSATLLAVEFDLERLEVRGPAFAIASGLRQRSSADHPSFDLSRSGILAYYAGGIGGDLRRLAWLGPDYEELASWSDDRRAFTELFFAAPRGDRLVSTMLGTDGLFSIWASELESPRLHPYLQVAGRDVEPVCLSSDGSMLIYSVVDGAERTIHTLDAQGKDTTLMSMAVNNMASPATLADENRSLLFSSWIGTPSVRWMELPTNVDPEAALPHADQATVLIANAESPALSPDGRRLAYTSAVSGRNEVYVRAWLGQGKMGPPLQVSREGGRYATWYTTSEGALQIRFGVGESMLAAGFDPSTGRSALPVVVRASMGNVVSVAHLADGRILGLMVDDDEKPVDRIDLRVGFGEELARRVGEVR